MRYRRSGQILALIATISATMASAQAHIVSMPSAAVASTSTSLSPVKQAELGLRMMGEPIHRAKHAAVDLVRECTRDNAVMEAGEVDFIGTDVLPILPENSAGLCGDAYLPPRKQYLDLHTNQLSNVMPLLQAEIQGISSPDPALKNQIGGDVIRMNDYFTDAGTHLSQVNALIGTQPYDGKSITREAKVIHEDLCEIDKLRRKIYEEIKHDQNNKQLDVNATKATPAK